MEQDLFIKIQIRDAYRRDHGPDRDENGSSEEQTTYTTKNTQSIQHPRKVEHGLRQLTHKANSNGHGGKRRKPVKRTALEAGVGIPESAVVDSMVEQLKHDVERLAKQNHDSFAATLRATLSTINKNNARFTKVEAKSEKHEHT